MIRPPAVSGQFYPASPEQLKTMIGQMVDENATKEDVIGLVLPHAGYPYSGPVVGATLSRAKVKNTFIIMGPNHTGLGKPLSIMAQGKWTTPLGDIEIDSELSKKILATSSYLEEDNLAHQFEHAIEVQLPFLQYFKSDFKLVPIVLTYATGHMCKQIGKEIARAVKELKREVIIIASSDMSHYEPQESASDKDNQAIEAMLNLDGDALLKRVAKLNISMCGYAPVVSLLSAAKELGATKASLVKYQTSGDTTGDYARVVGYAGIIINAAEKHPLVKLARQTVTTYIKEGNIIEAPAKLTPEMTGKAGVFVSIHKLDELRGCIGTFEPTKENVAQEIIVNAISSATRDPRFPPVTADELDLLDYSIDVLSEPELIESTDQLDPKKYGVIVEAGIRRGLLLPDLEGVDTADQQIAICCLKAGITPSTPVKIYRFEVKRYR